MNSFTLAAFSAERRIAAIALFRGTNIEDIRLRHLPVESAKALGSVRQLVTRFLEQHEPEFLALSVPSIKSGARIRDFHNVVMEIAKGQGMPVMPVDDPTLRSAFGHPALSRKEQVRRIGRTIWPELTESKSKRATVDAATVGLYVQTERLFSQYEAHL